MNKEIKAMTKEEAFDWLDYQGRIEWQEHAEVEDLGRLRILSEREVDGHKAWEYYFENFPVELLNENCWFFDNISYTETVKGLSDEAVNKELSDYLTEVSKLFQPTKA